MEIEERQSRDRWDGERGEINERYRRDSGEIDGWRLRRDKERQRRDRAGIMDGDRGEIKERQRRDRGKIKETQMDGERGEINER